eukprot:g23071.t1
MGEKSICFLAHALPRALMRLRILKLDGTHFEEPSWCVLELGLADMAIGRRSQDVACLVGELPLSLPGLKSLNLSGNFFSFEGCKALAHSLEGHGNLEILDLSYNAGGFVLTDSAGAMNIQAENLFSALRSDSRSQGISAFNPVSLVCEGVGKSKSLTTLKLVGCQLNFDEDFILEECDALQSKQVGLEELDLGNNAFQGVMGVRCLLRILITHKSLKNLVLTNIREALPSCVARGDEILKMWNKNQSVPTQGHVSFAFRFPMELGVNVDPEQLISRLLDGMIAWKKNRSKKAMRVETVRVNEKRKLKVGLVDFVKVAQLFHGLADLEARLLFLEARLALPARRFSPPVLACPEAMAVDLNLKLSHVRYLSELDPVLRTEVVDRLLPAVPEIHTLGGFDLAVHCGHSGARQPLAARKTFHDTSQAQQASLCRDRTSIVNLLLFNPACADGRYEFDVSEPAHRKMLDDLIIVNHWERDCAMNLITVRPSIQRKALSLLGIASCDNYNRPWAAWTSIRALESLKVKVFRSVAHRLVLTPSQCSWVLDALPPTAMERDLELRESARVEAFVVLYARCNDISALLSDKDTQEEKEENRCAKLTQEFGLFSLQHLTREEVLTECLVPQVDNAGDFNSAGRLKLVGRRPSAVGLPPMPDFLPVKPKTRSERVEEARLDAERMRPILQDLDYGMLDNPVSLGFANRYMMNLELHEDWHCAQCLLAVCKLEPGENIDEPYWSEKQHLAKKGSKWLVPDEWNKEIPQVGVFGMTFLQGLNDSDMELRMRLGEEFRRQMIVSRRAPQALSLNLTWPVADFQVTAVPEVPTTVITRLTCGVNLQGEQVCRCDDGWFGPECDQLCNCTGDGIASCNEGPQGNGTCNCKDGYIGERCEECKQYFYNLQNGCSIYCHPDDYCSGHGECTTHPVTHQINGCLCQTEWAGADCSECSPGWYPARVCNVYCSTNFTCNGKGQCSDLGTCLCDPGRRGARCDLCEEESWIFAADDGSNGCDDGREGNGTCICKVGFDGPVCNEATSYQTTEWSVCDGPCGGAASYRSRLVRCYNTRTGAILEDSKCEGEKPPEQEATK